MKVKYFDLDGAEHVVDVPDDIKQLNITLESPVQRSSAWPPALVIITITVCFTILVAALAGAFHG